MALRFYNTFTKKIEEFSSIRPGEVRMYTCGPTVYDYAHIGNYRAYIFEDLLRRYLKYKGYNVIQVMNVTDIDDKSIRASREQGIRLQEYTRKYKDAFFEDIDTLNIERAEHYPVATEHIPEMVEMIKTLLERGHAYQKDGSIYFEVKSFPPYGKLSGFDISQLKAGARIDSDEYEKETASDFALWKAWDEDDGEVFWETELGKGRPGWHIECSAMSIKYLGQPFDIHTGGVDNIFPHHENEIAQSEGASGDKFANCWLHNAHLMVEGRKMAKSFGNFYTLKDLLKLGHHPTAIRYQLLTIHYRQQLNFTFEGLSGALSSLQRLRDFWRSLEDVRGDNDGGKVAPVLEKAKTGFEEGLDEDLNISPALASIFDMVREVNSLIAEGQISKGEAQQTLNLLKRFDAVLGFIRPEESTIDEEIEALIEGRNQARGDKNWAEADRIRDELLKKGIVLEDTKEGTKWKRKLE
ncbi:MAG: cysteine--tRNA ligase [Candidatus Zixiibacteriota bacterium]